MKSQMSYAETWKRTKKCHIRNFNYSLVKKTVDDDKQFKTAKSKFCIRKKNILQLIRPDGTVAIQYKILYLSLKFLYNNPYKYADKRAIIYLGRAALKEK